MAGIIWGMLGATIARDSTDGSILGLFFAGTVMTIMAVFFLTSDDKRSFSANEYKIEYKITTFEGKSDTTYVLIRK